jgi:hypothetical protein
MPSVGPKRMNFSRFAIIVLSFSMLCSCSTPQKEASMDIQEVSCNFDLKNIQPFLARIPTLLDSGFTADNAIQIAAVVSKLKIDEEKQFEFPIRFKGAAIKLKIQAVMDDIESPDLYIFTSKELAGLIDEELQKFNKENAL